MNKDKQYSYQRDVKDKSNDIINWIIKKIVLEMSLQAALKSFTLHPTPTQQELFREKDDNAPSPPTEIQ
ncbi:hypothetical protein J6590_087953 [Homalodisca vitripennis]|nr:hypothetical protein J6590_087953 [Homalodisca vitripennis]